MDDEPTWHFGPFRLEPANARLWRGPELIHLRPKSFAVLHYLLTHAGRLVPKDALLEAVWPDVVVSEAMLPICLSELRRVLGETRQAPQFIETVTRRGYRFIGAVRQGAAPAAIPPLPPPGTPGLLVGRAAALAQVQAWWERAQQGARQVVFVTGEAGIGKTTLVDAWCARAAAAGPLRVGRGQCLDQHGAGEAYLPVLEALGHLCRGPAGAGLVAQLAQYAPTWLLQLPAVLRPGDVEGLHRRVLGATQERMLREFAEVVEVLTTAQPLVLVVEDMHWSDAATLDLLAYLARRRGPARLLVLGTYRPAEVIARGHPWAAVKQELTLHGLCQEVALGWLTEAEVGQYLGARFAGGAVPAALVRLVAQRTDGNPLFLVAMVDYLVRQGWVAVVEGQVTVPVGVETLATAVPDSLRQLLELQFEQLEPEAQRLLETASVAGSEFAAALVAAGLEVPVGQVEEWCAALVRREQFLRTAGLEEWPDGTVAGRYGFVHGLYQQVLYDRLLVGRRAVLHRRLGERQEAAFGERAHEHAAALAVHFEGGREPGRAVHYRRQAADTALRRYAYREAVEHLTTALALLQTLPETPERARQELGLLIALGPPLAAVRGQAVPEVEHTYRRAHALCQQVGDIAQLAPALVGLRVWYSIRGMLQSEREMGEQLLDLAQRLQDPNILLEAYRSLGMSYFMSGEFVAARRHLEQGLILASSPERHALPSLRSTQVPGVHPHLECLVYIAYALWYLGYPDQALQRSHEAVHLAQVLSHPYSLALALASAAWVHQYRREASAAQELAEAAIAVTAEHEFVQRGAIASIRYGWALAIQGQAQVGIGHLQQGLAAYRATGAGQMWPAYLAVLAEVYAHAGQVEDGLAALHEAVALVDAMGGFFSQAELYRLKGELLLQQAGSPERAAPPETSQSVRHTAAIHKHPGDHTEAEACFRWALEIAGRQHAKALELRAAMSLVRLWQQQEKRAAAYALLAPIYEWFTEGFDTADLQEAQSLLTALGG